MKKYVKPEVVETKEYAEGVYLASGGSTDNSSGPEETCLLYTSPSPRDRQKSRMPSSA